MTVCDALGSVSKRHDNNRKPFIEQCHPKILLLVKRQPDEVEVVDSSRGNNFKVRLNRFQKVVVAEVVKHCT